MKKYWIGLLLAAALPVFAAGCGAQKNAEPYEQNFYAMDTAMSIRAYGDDARDAVTESIAYINTLEQDISRTRENSDIWKLNHAEGTPVEVSEQTDTILRAALMLAAETEGRFDPTIAPLSDLWAIGTEDAKVPEQEEIDAVLPQIDYTGVMLNGSAAALSEGQQIDLGGIGKGYAADHVVEILREHGVERAIVALGGNIYVLGEKEEGTPWTVGISDPDQPGEYFATVSVADATIVTSGDYERYLEVDGKRYCHIFDPETGYPAETDIRSVTIVSQDSTRADACTTALFVMGYTDAMQFCQAHNIEAVFVCADGSVHVTNGLKDCFRLQNTEYQYEE